MSFRLVNILHEAKLNHEEIWKISKNERKKYLFEKSIDQLKSCLNDENLEFIDNLEAALEMKVIDIPQLNVTEETLETAVRLTFCPPQELTLALPLFQYIFETSDAKDMILALTNIHRTSSETTKEISKRLFLKITEIFHLQNRNIEDLLSVRSFNFRNCSED